MHRTHETTTAAAELEANPQRRTELTLMKRARDMEANGMRSMEDFWIAKGWYRVDEHGEIRLKFAKWSGDEQAQVEAIRLLVKILGKDPRHMTLDDFVSNRLGGLITNQYKSSPYAALDAAFPELGILPWEMSVTPNNFYNYERHRVAATRWLIEDVLKTNPRDVFIEDFSSHGLGGLIDHYSRTPYLAVKEAYPELNIQPWEMIITPANIFDSKENRVAATRWLVKGLGKEPREMIQRDFASNGLAGLMNHYNDSPYEAMLEAGLVTPADETYMRFQHTR